MRREFLPYCRPAIDADDIAAVVDSMQHGWLTTGPKVAEFEAAFAQASGIKHAIALNSCTSGLHLGMVAMGIGPGDEVIMPSLTFVAGAQCARQLGATPVFCDIEADSLCISPRTIDAVVSERTKLIVPMDYGGHPVGIEKIAAYAKSRNVAVLEDAAHAAGTLDAGRWPGKVAPAVYSFYATKNLTSAEGGMFATDDDALAEKVRIYALHGMNRDAWKRYTQGGTWRYDVVVTGYKCNLPDICASLGIAQLRKLSALQQRRDEIAARYRAAIESIPGISVPPLPSGKQDRHSWCVFAILVEASEAGLSRDELIERMREENIGTSVHFIPSHLFTSYREAQHVPLPVTERVWERMLSLPLFPTMSERDVEDVIEALRNVVDRARRTKEHSLVHSAP